MRLVDPIRNVLPASIRAWLSARTRIDTRSLAVIRIAAGVLILGDLVSRSRHARMMYTDEGAVSRTLARSLAPEGAISVFWLTGDPVGVAALFVLHALVGVALLVGYHTRLMTVLAFVFVVSLDMRNVLVLSHADVLFRLLLFWAIFLPLGERWSIDAAHRTRDPIRAVSGLAPAMFLIQMVIMYAVNAVWKLTDDGWMTGETPMLVFGLDDITFLLGDSMRAVPELLVIGGLGWFALMVVSPLLLVMTGRARALFAGAYALGHLAFAVTVRIGAFPYVALMGLVGFLQPAVWDELDRRITSRGWDGRYTQTRRTMAARAAAIPRPTVTHPDLRRLLDGATSVGLILAVASMLVLAGALVPHAGTLTDTDIDRDTRLELALEGTPGAEQLHATQAAIGFAQPSWTIFAPHGRTVDRYYVFPALTADGDWIDAFADRPLSFDRPYDELQVQYHTYRERFFLNGVARPSLYPGAAEAYAEYLCTTHEEELVSITMFRVVEQVTKETLDDPDERDRWSQLLYAHGCGEHEPVIHEGPDW